MPSLSVKISNFINKAQTRGREIATQLNGQFDYDGYQSKDSKDSLIKLYESRAFIRLLSTEDKGGLTNKEINAYIDFFTDWLQLNKLAIVQYTNLQMPIQDNITVPAGIYALQADLNTEIATRSASDSALSARISVLENTSFNPADVFPPGFWDQHATSNVNVWNDDNRLHLHANKAILDQITQQLFDALSGLISHYNSVGGTSGLHVSNEDRANWNGKVTIEQLNSLSSVYAPITHVQAGADKHTISQITGLQSVIEQINLDIANMAGADGVNGREVEFQMNNTTLEWRYAGDIAWIALGDLKGDKGDPFTIDYRGLSSQRLSSAFDGFGSDYTFLETDTGYLYFRNPVYPATIPQGWSTGLKFLGDNGWSPVVGIYEVSPDRSVFEIVDWVGGQGNKPVFDAGINPPSAIRWFIGPNGVTLYETQASNIKGPKGNGYGPIIGGSGPLAGRGTHDLAKAGFIYLRNDVSPQTIYIKLTDSNADWSPEYPWQGTPGPAGASGQGIARTITQAAHGLLAFRGLSYESGSYKTYAFGDKTPLGVITQINSADQFTFVPMGFVSGLTGLTANTLYYLQKDGQITTTKTSKPIFFATSTTDGYVFPVYDYNKWVEITGNVASALPGIGYLANSALKLEITINQNYDKESIKVASNNTGGWKILLASPIVIKFLDETIATSLESNTAMDSVELLNVAPNVYQVVNSVGNLIFN